MVMWLAKRASDRAAESIQRTNDKDRVRQRIVRLVFIVYWLLIFEGALRRWVFPHNEYLLFFIRDPFVLLIYWIVLRHRLWPKSWPFLTIGIIIAFLCIFLIHIQVIFGGYDSRYLLIAGYGWRNYFFYLPLAFIIAEQFQRTDLDRVIKHTLLIAIPSAAIVVLQFYSPASAVINLGLALGEAHQYWNLGASLGYVRPTGFFTSTLGHGDFVASLCAMLLAMWIMPDRDRHIRRILLWLGTASACVMIAMSGSRGLSIYTGICVLTALLAGFVVRERRLHFRSRLLPVALVLSFIALYPILFPTPYEVFLERWVSAQTSESYIFKYGIFGRAVYDLYSFLLIMEDTPAQGYLLGLGGNAANRLSWVQYPSVAGEWSGYGNWIESGLSRHIAELGPGLGLLFIFYRFVFTFWLGRTALKATRSHRDPLSLMLFAFAGVLLFYGQITGHGTHNGYVWLFVGFCLAACTALNQTKTK